MLMVFGSVKEDDDHDQDRVGISKVNKGSLSLSRSMPQVREGKEGADDVVRRRC